MAEEDFQPSDALPPTGQDRRGLAGIGAFLPMTVPKTTPYGEVSLSDIEMGIPPALKDAYSGIMKFGALMRGELTPQDIQQLAFDTSMNVTGGSLLGSQLLPKAVPKGALGMGTSKIIKQDEFFEAMGEEGARLEYPRINDLLFKYEDRNNRKALEMAFADPDYTQYKQVLDANLLRMFPDGKIPLQRITNYAEVMNEGAKKNIEKRTFDIEEIAFAGNDAERELIVNLNGDLRSFSLAKTTGDIFNKIDTPVYHFSQNVDPGFTKFDPDKAPAALDGLGIHVGSTPKAAEDRFMDLTFGFGGRETRRSIAKEKGVDYDTALSYMELPKVRGNVGYEKIGSGQFSLPIPRKSLGGSIPLKADLSKPYLPEGNYKYSQDPKQWQESEITDHLLDKYNDDRGKSFTMQHLVGDKPNFPFGDFRKFIGEFRKDLAKDGFTHLPYYNDVEDVASTSYIMLTDRPKGSTKVLQSPFAKKDPAAADDPDIMKEEGGVVSMKDKAVNMTRKPQGIEPFIKFMV